MRTDEQLLLVLDRQASAIEQSKAHLYRCSQEGRTDVGALETLRRMKVAHRGSLGRAPLHVLELFASTYGEDGQAQGPVI